MSQTPTVSRSGPARAGPDGRHKRLSDRGPIEERLDSAENGGMVIAGRVENGVVVLEGQAALPEGAAVTVLSRSGAPTRNAGRFLPTSGVTRIWPRSPTRLNVVRIPIGGPQFEAVAGEISHWKIEPPEALLTHVRERLAQE